MNGIYVQCHAMVNLDNFGAMHGIDTDEQNS